MQNDLVHKVDLFFRPFMGEAPKPARILALAGCVPFILLGLLSLFLGDRVEAALLYWGALIFTGLGMARFGFASAGMGSGPTWFNLTVGVCPMVFAWFVLVIFPPSLAMLALLAGMGVLHVMDITLARGGGAPLWWKSYRLSLSVVAAVCLLIGAF